MASQSSHSELMPGSMLGKYRIERLLGHGGMATVYLATQEGTGLQVALKVLMFRGDAGRPGGDVARFIREARLAGGIRHPHWVSVYETGYDAKNNLYYIAMEQMRGSLAQRLRAQGALEESEAIAVVEQIAFALDKAYETQMVHRDIKPGNILYNSAGVCKLTDFGIAKSSRNEETQLTLREAVFGTPAYMSPEQATDARMVDSRSDIYSLGTVFFELLSGERPYQGETPVQVLAQVITDKPPPDVRTKPKARRIHSDTAKLVMSMMAKDPAARPQTPAELIAKLQQLKARVPYAKPVVSEEDPPYDDSTIIDHTNPPPLSSGATPSGMPGSWSDRSTATYGASAAVTGTWNGAPAVQQTDGNPPTFATQAVRDPTMATRADVSSPDPEPRPGPKRKGGHQDANARAVKVLIVISCILVPLALLGFWALHTNILSDWFDLVPHRDPGQIVSLPDSGLPSGPNPAGDVAAMPQDGESVVLVLKTPEDVGEAIAVVVDNGRSRYTTQVPAYGVERSVSNLEAGKWTVSCPDSERKERLNYPLPATVTLTNGINPYTVRVTQKPMPELELKNPNAQPLQVVVNGTTTNYLPPHAVPQSIPVPTGKVTIVYYNPQASSANRVSLTNDLVWDGRWTPDLTLAESQQQAYGTMLFHNPNDAKVWVQLEQDDGETFGSFDVKSEDDLQKPYIPSGRIIVKYYALNDKYVQTDDASAATKSIDFAADASTPLPVELDGLTLKPLPILVVTNAGRVPLDVTLTTSTGAPRREQIPANTAREIQNLPANEQMVVKWSPVAAAGSRYHGGETNAGPYSWNARDRLVIQAAQQQRPSIVIQNRQMWDVKVTVTGPDGQTVLADQQVPAWSNLVQEVSAAGSYKVQAVADVKRPSDHQGMSVDVKCDWGRPATVDVSTAPTEAAKDENSRRGDEELVSVGIRALLEAKDDLDALDWSNYGAQEVPALIQERLMTAAKRLAFESADSLGQQIPLAFDDWKRAVAAKGAPYQANDAWDNISGLTARSGNWKVFLGNLLEL